MKKTKYEFKCDVNVTLNTINEFLKANNYKELKTKEGLTYYQYLDAVSVGFLEYEVSGDLLTIYAYIRSPKKPMPLDNSFFGIIPKNHYKGVISPLLQALSNINTQSFNSQSVESQPSISNVQNNNVTGNTIINNTSNSVNNNSNVEFKPAQQATNEKVAVIAFVLSIIGLILSFAGITFGLIIIILEYFFAIQGLKTKKKGLAIVAIILASLALIINIITFLELIV